MMPLSSCDRLAGHVSARDKGGLRDLVFFVIAGGPVLNVLREEPPYQRQGRFGVFMAGAVLYAALLSA
jgi:hypothetical protein